MIPFRLTLQSGVPVHEQVAFAAKKAMISGRAIRFPPFALDQPKGERHPDR